MSAVKTSEMIHESQMGSFALIDLLVKRGFKPCRETKCTKCGGTGEFRSVASSGVCYPCGGSGKRYYWAKADVAAVRVEHEWLERRRKAEFATYHGAAKQVPYGTRRNALIFWLAADVETGTGGVSSFWSNRRDPLLGDVPS